MASDLLSIGRSGTRAARVALDLTAQNIANASSEGYVRRSVLLKEVSASGSLGRPNDVYLSGVRLDRVIRNSDPFRQAEVRRTSADAARAEAEVAGLERIEAAVEQSDAFSSIVRFEAALQQLASDPIDSSLRAAVIEEARTMANSLNLASNSLDAVGNTVRFEVDAGVDQVNVLAAELARVNLRLARSADASSDQTMLLDQRDLLLEKLSAFSGIDVSIAANQTAEVRLGGSSGPQLVSFGNASAFAMTTAADGTISFTVGGSAVAVTSGSLGGNAQALQKLKDINADLDALAGNLIDTVNTVQTGGVALDGSAGQPLLSGTGAGDIALAIEQGSLLATAPAGADANSRDATNLIALRNALGTSDPAGSMDALLFHISSAVSGRSLTRDALQSIADTARIALQSQAGVDLDQETANLVRFQQAFQASGRVMQVASDLFDTLLAIG